MPETNQGDSDKAESHSAGWVTSGLSALGRGFAAISVIVVVSVLLLLGVNYALRPYAGPLMPVTKIGTLHNWGQKEAENWIGNYGFETLRKVYPDKSDDEIRKLVYAKFRMGNKYATYVEFTHEPFVVNGMAFHEAGFRLGGKDQCAWPLDPKKTHVFMFGGSTMFGAGAADHETISAFLQESLRKKLGENICVFNFGVGAYYSNQEVVAFWKLASQGIHPDMVLFLDGLNDFFQKTEDTAHSGYYREFENVIVSLQRQLMVDRGVRWNLEQIWQQSPLMRWIRNTKKRELALDTPGREGGENAAKTTQVRSFNDGSDRKHIAHVVDRLFNNFRLAGGMARAVGAESGFIIQPTPMYAFDLSKHFFAVPEWHQYTRIGYPLLRQRLENGDSNENVIWCADVGRDTKGEALYSDPVHYTPAMNRRIAVCAMEYLEKTGVLQRLAKRVEAVRQ